MKVWTPHLRISWGGSLGVPELEIWSNTVNFVSPTGLAIDVTGLQEAADRLSPVVSGWFTQAEALHGQAARLKWLKAVWVLADGHQRDPNTIVHDYPNGVVGAKMGNPTWVTTYALTLRTEVSRGRAHAGRIFPPLNGASPEGDTPYLSIGFASPMATRFAACLSAMNAEINAIWEPGVVTPTPAFAASVVSPGDTAKGTGPLYNKIISVVIDRVGDVQHRRTNRVPRLEIAAQPVTTP